VIGNQMAPCPAVLETARGQVAELVGCEPSEIVFTSGATEAATAVIKLSSYPIISPIEHDCLWVHAEKIGCDKDCYRAFAVATDGIVAELDAEHTIWSNADLYCVQSGPFGGCHAIGVSLAGKFRANR